ncbi:MAG: hypothetical protein AAFU73_23070 [Planctomycetota bacterium]
MSRPSKTILVEPTDVLPPELAGSESTSVGCLVGSPVYHAQATSDGDPYWTARCGAKDGARSNAPTTPLGELASWHRFRVCRACFDSQGEA